MGASPLAPLLLAGVLYAMSCSCAGLLPLLLPASGKFRRTVLTLGVGVLLATAFVVLLPEGIARLYTPDGLAHAAAAASASASASADRVGLHDALRPRPTTAPSSSEGSDSWNPLAGMLGGSVSESDAWRGELDRFKTAPSSPPPQPPSASTPPNERGHAHGHAHEHGEGGEEHGHARRRLLQEAGHAHNHAHEGEEHDHNHDHADGEAPVTASTPPAVAPQSMFDRTAEPIVECFSEGHSSRYLGMSMALGFVLMLLVERLCAPRRGDYLPLPSVPVEEPMPAQPQQAQQRRGMGMGERCAQITGLSSPELRSSTLASGSVPTPRTVSLQVASAGGAASPNHSFPSPAVLSSSASSSPSASSSGPRPPRSPTLLLGVYSYALVEGVWMGSGAASTSSPWDGWVGAEMIESMVLHKAPTCFGLACFLLYVGSSAASVRKHVLAYSITAPISALLTLAFGSELPSSAPGLLLLFAGGCFVFTIAVHILPALQEHATRTDDELNGHHSHSHGSHAHSHGHVSASPGGRSLGPSSTPRPASDEHSITPPSDDDDDDHRSEARGKATEEKASIPWSDVWALIAGLLVPVAASFVQERQPLIR